MTAPDRFPDTFLVPEAKILGYLLKLDHVDGGSKARFFHGFGFRIDAPDILAGALLSHATPQNMAAEAAIRLGDRKLVFEGVIVAPNGRTLKVRTVWRVDRDGTALFVTAVPLRA